jgi:hypothetical protein
MPRWVPFIYREFYDVPRTIVAADDQHTYLFDCPFDEVLDNYSPNYDVYLMPQLTNADLNGSWELLSQRAVGQLGQIPVGALRFDTTRRHEVDLDVLREIEPE